MSDPTDDLKEKTQKTAELYFQGVRDERPYDLWRSFNKELAKEISMYYTGKLYAREKIPHRIRQLITVAALTVLERTEELKLHLHGALNVGCSPQEITEVIFQMATYGGVPVVNSALKAFRTVLQEKGLWPLK
ncbi:MAG: carboxymuconolactone decarboxylase family protein [Deltaproteobacteria bacterium]|nr:carboxymuconolactone decarboxylase family protein [Deltaproteobacteria bacterium]